MPKSVVIIDDEPVIARLTALWIEAAGIKTVISNDGPSGLAAVARHRPNLILLDIRMPQMDGFEVNRRLREMPDLAHIPVIFLSAHAQETARLESLAGGGRCFLSKPYEVKSLIAAIHTVLKGSTPTVGANEAR
jgi:CheY-like chemotaxis protein